jgi:hypothetical protein
MDLNNCIENETIDGYIDSNENKECLEQIEDKVKQVFNEFDNCLNYEKENQMIECFQQLIVSNVEQKESEENEEFTENKEEICVSKVSQIKLSSSVLGLKTETNGTNDGINAFGDRFDDKTDDKQLNQLESNSNNDKELVSKNSIQSNNRLKEMQLLEKWGESVGIYDSNGCPKRIVAINELNNYFKLKLTSLYSNDYVFYCSLINSRYPRFYTSTVNYYQRWRMRYNIFVDKLLDKQTIRRLTQSENNSLLIHIGEIHLYFDIVPKYCQPVYVNSSFYLNKNNITDVSLDENLVSKMTKIVNSIRYSKDILQFKFPVNGDLFEERNDLFDKFMERQMEFVEEAIKVFRKTEQKKRKFRFNFGNCRNISPNNNFNQRECQTKERAADRELVFEDNKQRNERYENRNHSMTHTNNRQTNNSRGFRPFTQTKHFVERNTKTIDDKMEWNESFAKSEQNDQQLDDISYDLNTNETSFRGRQNFNNNRNNDYKKEAFDVESEPNNGINRLFNY